MKKIYLLLTLVFTFYLVAQGNDNIKYCNADTINTYEYIVGSSFKQISKREIYTYNKGNNVEYLNQKWNESTLEFDNFGKNTYQYNGNGDRTESLVQKWDVMGKKWVNSNMYKFTYSNKNYKEIERSYFIWQVATNKWRHNNRNLTEYDVDDNMTSYSSENYITKFDTLGFSSRQLNTYYSTNKLKQIEYQNFDQTLVDWVNANLVNYNYDANNLLIENATKSWSTTLNAYVNNNRRTNQYDANNLELESKVEVWNPTLGVFVNRNLIVSIYGNKNTRVKAYQLEWNITFNVWDSFSKTEYFYNANLKTDSALAYLWNITGPWTKWNKTLYTYDLRGSLTNRLELDWNSRDNQYQNRYKTKYDYNKDTFLIAEETFSRWDASLNDYENKSRIEYSCPENKNTGLLNIENDLFSIFPNPTTGNILNAKVLNPTFYEIYTAMGTLVSDGFFEKGTNSIEISRFTKGIYFIKTQTSTQKIIIQ